MKKIILTNWINMIGCFLTFLIYPLFYISDSTIKYFYPNYDFLKLLYAQFIYGSALWFISLILIIIFDLILIKKNKKLIEYKLFIEWFVISLYLYFGMNFIFYGIPFIKNISIISIFVFLITQNIRKGMIIKIINSK